MNKTMWVWVIFADGIPYCVVDTKENAIAFIRNNIFPNRIYDKKTETETKIIKALNDYEFYNEVDGNYAIYEVVNMI